MMSPDLPQALRGVRWCTLVVALGACGRIGYDAADAPASSMVDAAVDAPQGPPCRSADRFEAPTALTDLNTAAPESSLRLALDGTGYFARELDAVGLRIFTTKVSGTRFTAPVQVPGPVNSSDAGEPTVAADGSLVLFSGIRGGTSYDIYGSVNLGGMLSTPTPMTPLNTSGPEFTPYLLGSGTAVYFVRVVQGAGVVLMRATVDDAGQMIGEPTRAASLPVVTSPVVSEDELELFYAEQGDVYRATRSAVTELFSAGVRSASLSSADDDAPTWLSPDRCILILSSTRPGGAGRSDLWAARRL